MKRSLRAKFRIGDVKSVLGAEGQTKYFEVKGFAVADTSETNKPWSRWTPSGELTLHQEETALRTNQEVFLDLIPLEDTSYDAKISAPILRLIELNKTFGDHGQENVKLSGYYTASPNGNALYNALRLSISNREAFGALEGDTDYALVVTPAE